MPGYDGTGPMGTGPMTGRKAGFCAGYGVRAAANPMLGSGFEMRGRCGWRNMYRLTGLTGWQRAALGWPGVDNFPLSESASNREQPLQELKNRAAFFEKALSHLRKRIEDLESQKDKA